MKGIQFPAGVTLDTRSCATLFVSTSGSHPNSIKMNVQKINFPLKSWFFHPSNIANVSCHGVNLQGRFKLKPAAVPFHVLSAVSQNALLETVGQEFPKKWSCSAVCFYWRLSPSIEKRIRPLMIPFPVSLCPFLISHVLLSTVKSAVLCSSI